jgi:hypothetical protein
MQKEGETEKVVVSVFCGHFTNVSKGTIHDEGKSTKYLLFVHVVFSSFGL